MFPLLGIYCYGLLAFDGSMSARLGAWPLGVVETEVRGGRMDLDLSCVGSLLVLLQEQQYERAAARLHVTSSALTKRIQRLERQVGATLVSRGADGAVVATPAGRRFAVPATQLLADADAARQAAREEHSGCSLVLGVPAGPVGFVRELLSGAVRNVRSVWPATRVACRSVPFPALTSCLLERRVDVLWTAAPVRHRAVVSVALPLTCARVGIVRADHDLADSGSMDVEQFAALPMLYNPAIPDEWMSVFYLGDVRPRREAQLVSAEPADMAAVGRESLRRSVVVVGPEILAPALAPDLRSIRLLGAPPLVFHLAHLRSERRAPVHALVTALTGH